MACCWCGPWSNCMAGRAEASRAGRGLGSEFVVRLPATNCRGGIWNSDLMGFVPDSRSTRSASEQVNEHARHVYRAWPSSTRQTWASSTAGSRESFSARPWCFPREGYCLWNKPGGWLLVIATSVGLILVCRSAHPTGSSPQLLNREICRLFDQVPRHRSNHFLRRVASPRRVHRWLPDLQVRTRGAGDRGERRHHPGELVSHLAQSRGVTVPEGLVHRRQMAGQSGPKGPAEPLQSLGIAPAGGQQGARVRRSAGGWSTGGQSLMTRSIAARRSAGTDGLRTGSRPCPRRGSARGPRSATRRQGDDGQMSSGRPLALADRPDDLESVQLGHVDVQEDEVERPPVARARASRPSFARRT